jgi:hypothetical protein
MENYATVSDVCQDSPLDMQAESVLSEGET